MKHIVTICGTYSFRISVEAASYTEAGELALKVSATIPGLPTYRADILDPRVEMLKGDYDVCEVCTEGA